MELKTYDNLSQKEYRQNKEFLSASDIKILLDNPYKFINPAKETKSDNLILGSVIHSLILEKDNFDKDFLVMPELNLRTKEGKEQKELLEKQALNENKELVKNEIYLQALEVVENFNKTDIANLFKKQGKSELSIFGDIEGTPCKCRPDFLLDKENIILDLKTTSNENGASPDIFAKNIANFKYYIQASFYLELTKAKDFYFIVIETKAPFMVGVYKLDEISLDFGKNEIRRAFEIYKNIDKFKKNIYIDTFDFKKVQELTLPNYVFYNKNASM